MRIPIGHDLSNTYMYFVWVNQMHQQCYIRHKSCFTESVLYESNIYRFTECVLYDSNIALILLKKEENQYSRFSKWFLNWLQFVSEGVVTIETC